MNKYMFDFMINSIDENEGVQTFDTWGCAERSYIYTFIKNLDTDFIKIGDELFSVQWRKGGGCGMGASPDSIKMTRCKKNNTFILDEVVK